jgi:hypothetical protein
MELQEIKSLEELSNYLNKIDYYEEDQKTNTTGKHVTILYGDGQITHTKGGNLFGQRNEFSTHENQIIFKKEFELKLNHKIGDRSYVLLNNSGKKIHNKIKELYQKDNPLPLKYLEEDLEVYRNMRTILKEIIEHLVKKFEQTDYQYSKLLEHHYRSIDAFMNFDKTMQYAFEYWYSPLDFLTDSITKTLIEDGFKDKLDEIYKLDKEISTFANKYKHLKESYKELSLIEPKS